MSDDLPLDPSAYGDDDDEPVDVGPPCDRCGDEAVERVDGLDLCGGCLSDLTDERDDQDDERS